MNPFVRPGLDAAAREGNQMADKPEPTATPTPPGQKDVRIFVKAPNWVGDAVMATPSLAFLRAAHPGARLTLMARPWVAPVFDHNPDIDHLWVMDDAQSPRACLKAALRVRRAGFHMGLSFPGSFRAGLLMTLAGIPHRFGYSRPATRLLFNRPVTLSGEMSRLHQVYQYLELLRPLCGAPPRQPRLKLRAGELEREEVRHLLRQKALDRGRPLIGIAPGAINSSAKCWPTDRFACLADRLNQDHDAEVLLLGSPPERDVVLRVKTACRRPVHDLTGEVSLGRLVALMEHLDGMFCNDSGAMHLAAAFHVPLVAVFGPTDHRVTYPFSPTAAVVRNDRVECAGCMLRECHRPDHPCMRGVTVDQVLDAFKRMLAADRERKRGLNRKAHAVR